MNIVDKAIIYYNASTLKQKKLKDITKAEVQNAFKRDDLIVFTNSNKLEKYLETAKTKNQNLLLMSSGYFNGINFEKLYKKKRY